MTAIRFRTGTDFSIHQVVSLYNDAGWSIYTSDPATLEIALHSSLFVLTAWSGDQLVGLIRAIGDGVTIIYVQDILVLHTFRRQQIGRQLLMQLLEKYSHVRQIVLMTDKTDQTISFYENCGFSKTEHIQLQTFVRIKSHP